VSSIYYTLVDGLNCEMGLLALSTYKWKHNLRNYRGAGARIHRLHKYQDGSRILILLHFTFNGENQRRHREQVAGRGVSVLFYAFEERTKTETPKRKGFSVLVSVNYMM